MIDDKKFIETINVDEWEVETDTGWEDIVSLHKTIEYQIWEIETKSTKLKCADNHIIFDESYNEVFVSELVLGQKILTRFGSEEILSIKKYDEYDNMYDLELPEESNHRYYTNGILSHNTTTYTIYALWKCLFFKDTKILISANKKDSAIEFLSRIKLAYEMIPNWLKPRILTYNKSSIEFAVENGGKIEAGSTSADSGRGKSCNILIIDEFAHVPPHILNEYWTATYPIISAGKSTQVILVSTPNGLGNKFADIYFDALEGKSNEGFKSFRIDWWDVPGRDEAWKNQQLASFCHGDINIFKQEFENSFLAAKTPTLISMERISDLRKRCCHDIYFKPGELRIIGQKEYIVNQWFLPKDDRTYILGCDVADGVGKANSVIYVLDITNMTNVTCVASFISNQISTRDFAFLVFALAKHYNMAYIAIEANGLGRSILDILGIYGYENIIKVGNHKTAGIFSHVQIKIKGCLWLKEILESSNVNFNVMDEIFFDELSWFTKKQDATRHAVYQALQGKNDDRVIAMIWGLLVANEEIANQYYLVHETFPIGENIIAPKIIQQHEYKAINPEFDPFSEIIDLSKFNGQRSLDLNSETKDILDPEIIDEYKGIQTTKDMVSLKPSQIDSSKPYKKVEIAEDDLLLDKFLPGFNPSKSINAERLTEYINQNYTYGLNFSLGEMANMTVTFENDVFRVI